MLRSISKAKTLIVFSALLFMVGLASFIFAQNKPTSAAPAGQTQQIFVVTLVRVQPGMEREWQDLVKNEYMPAMKKGGVGEFVVLRRATFGEAGEFMLFRPIKNLAEFDEPSPTVKALGQAGEAAMSAKLNRVTANLRTVRIVTRPDLSIVPSGYAVKLVAMTRTSITPGRVADFEKAAQEQKAQLALIGKTNVKGSLVARVQDGGDPNEYWQSLLVDSFADLDQLGAAYRKAAMDAKLPSMPAGIITHAERATWRYVPELSIQQPAQKTTG